MSRGRSFGMVAATVTVFIIVPALWAGFIGYMLYWAVRVARLAWGAA